jgi:serine/threonine-protein kinase
MAERARATPAVAVGEVIAGRYRVDEIIGEGGMGVVVAATHLELGKAYAIKLMRAEVAATREAAERFRREAKAAADLESEHVAKVFDFGRREDETPFMIMERLVGEDLGQLVERGPLPIRDVALYAIQACDALAEAHARGIIHRDLKPSNLFLARGRDGSSKVKVLDFGISKLMTPEEGGLKTATGAVMGTPLFMSPEQIRASRQVDARTDIWAMGVVLYQLATTSVPFKGESLTQTLALVLESSPVPPSSLLPGIPAEFDAVVLRCLAKEPEDRYADVGGLMRALAPFAPKGAALVERAARILAGARSIHTPELRDGSADETLPLKPADKVSTEGALAATMRADAPRTEDALTATTRVDAGPPRDGAGAVPSVKAVWTRAAVGLLGLVVAGGLLMTVMARGTSAPLRAAPLEVAPFVLPALPDVGAPPTSTPSVPQTPGGATVAPVVPTAAATATGEPASTSPVRTLKPRPSAQPSTLPPPPPPRK